MFLYISIASFSVTVILVLLLIVSKVKNRHNTMEKEIEKRRREAAGGRKSISENYVKIYEIYERMPIVKQLTFNLTKSFTIIGEKDQRYLIKKTVVIVSGFISASVLLTVGFFIVNGNILYTLVFAVFVWYISDSYLDYFISASHTRLLNQMIDFISSVRQKYYEYHVVDDAVYEASRNLPKDAREMYVQGEKIYNIFMESNRDKALAEYMETAPNPFLKMFVNFSLLTMEYGDGEKDGSSVYLMNLGFLSKNIQLEIDKRKRLNYALKSMNFIALLPLVFITPVRNWSVNNFAPLGKFYASPAGRYVEFITIFIILISMILLSKVQNLDRRSKVNARIDHWIERLPLKIDKRQKKKWLLFIGGFLLSVMVILSVQMNSRFSLKEKVYYSDTFLGGNLSEEEIAKREAESIADYPFIIGSDNETSLETIEVYLESIEVEDEFRATRIQEKIQLYNSYYLSTLQVLLCLLVGCLAYYFPEINEKINNRLQAMELEDEIAGFRSIIMMLMYNKRMNVEEIIDWMESYAVLHKMELHRCQLAISAGEQEALIRLGESVDHPEMKRLIRQLQMASEDISLVEAFDELIEEKNHFFEQRKWNNDKMINRKILIGQNIGFLPAYSLIIFYMIVPMVISSINEMERFFNQIL